MNNFFPVHIAGQIIAFDVVTALVFWLALMGGIRALAIDQKRKAMLGAMAAGVLALWFGLIVRTAADGAYRIQADQAVLQPLVIAVLIPIAAGSLLLVSSGYRRIIDAIPQHWFAGHHALRIVFGYAFLALYEMGELPREFALSAGYGDVVSGVLAAIAAYLSFGRRRLAVPALILWNAVGILDFLTVVPLGLTQIGPSYRILDFFPLYLIPVYVVPIFSLMHVYSIRALILQRSRS
jgi:hypothetical protein